MKKLWATALATLALMGLMTLTAGAAGSVVFEEDFSQALTFGADNWYVDRYVPGSFDSVDGRLQITTGADATERNSGYTSSFYAYQGYKHNIETTSTTHLMESTLVVSEDMLTGQSQHTSLWLTVIDKENQTTITGYPLLGYTRNETDDTNEIKLWNTNGAGSWDVAQNPDGTDMEITAGEYKISIYTCGTVSSYFINDVYAGATTIASESLISNLLVQVYTYDNDEEYSVEWDDIRVIDAPDADDLANYTAPVMIEGEDGVLQYFATVDDAIAAATDGDTIVLAPGTYTQIAVPKTTAYNNMSLTFQGQEGQAENTIIEGSVFPTNHNTTLASTADIVIKNLTIEGTVDMQKTKVNSLTIENCIFTTAYNIKDDDDDYWALFADPSNKGGSITYYSFINNIVHLDNAASGLTRGIVSSSSDTVTITGNTFYGATSAVVEVWNATETVTITGNTFVDARVSVSSGVVDLVIADNSFSSDEDAYAIYLNQSFAYDKTTSPWTYDFTDTANAAYNSIDISGNTFAGYDNPFFIGFGYAFANPDMDFEDAVMYISHTYYTSDAELTSGEITSDDEEAFFSALQTALDNTAVAVAHINTAIVVTDGHTLTIPEGVSVVFGTNGSLSTSGTGAIVNENDVTDTKVEVSVNPETTTTETTTSTTVETAPVVDSALGSVNVTVDATSSDDSVTKAEITFTEAATANLASADSATIKTDVAEVVFSSEALSSIDAETTADVEVKLIVEAVEATALTETQQAVIPEDVTATIVDLTLIKVVNSLEDGKVVFDGTVTVTMPYVHEEGKAPVVYYVAEDGSLSKMNVVSYTDTTVTFSTTHFSHYMAYATTVSSSSGSSSSTYASSVASSSNGDVSLSATKATSGTKITITTDPDNGYEVGSVSVTYSSGREVSVTDNGDGTYSYLQPGAAVTITVTFVSEDGEDEEILPDEASGFYDVDSDAYYYDAMQWAVDNGITSGYADDTFRPTDSCTRAQAVTFLWRAAGEPTATIDNPFSDLDETAYYYNAVLWAVENGITTGYEDGTFRPSTTCNRGAIVTFLYRFAGEPTVSGTAMSDVAAGAYYYDAVLWAVENEITTGYADGTFQPSTTCNRGAIVTFLYRYLAD